MGEFVEGASHLAREMLSKIGKIREILLRNHGQKQRFLEAKNTFRGKCLESPKKKNKK